MTDIILTILAIIVLVPTIKYAHSGELDDVSKGMGKPL